MRLVSIAGILGTLLAAGCSGDSRIDHDPKSSLVDLVSGERAFEHVAALVNFGPRPAGSDALEASRIYIENELQKVGWVVQRQKFTDETDEGAVEFVNLRARFGNAGSDEPVIGLLATHYDSKLYKSFDFVGANDGGSSTALVIELARVLANHPEAFQGIELVFFDGEEAFGPNITSTDGLFGSRHYARQWLLREKKERPNWGVLLDMVGDRNLKIRAGVQIPGDSLQDLAENKERSGYVVDIYEVKTALNEMSRQLLKAAADLGYKSEVGISSNYIIDDHIPLNVSAGIPTINLIDTDYGYWHTPGDTLDKVSALSLEISGRLTLQYLEKYLLR
jgi:glutaminyl-peptide cyclotransferase